MEDYNVYYKKLGITALQLFSTLFTGLILMMLFDSNYEADSIMIFISMVFFLIWLLNTLLLFKAYKKIPLLTVTRNKLIVRKLFSEKEFDYNDIHDVFSMKAANYSFLMANINKDDKLKKVTILNQHFVKNKMAEVADEINERRSAYTNLTLDDLEEREVEIKKYSEKTNNHMMRLILYGFNIYILITNIIDASNHYKQEITDLEVYKTAMAFSIANNLFVLILIVLICELLIRKLKLKYGLKLFIIFIIMFIVGVISDVLFKIIAELIFG